MVYQFFDGIVPTETRLRCERLKTFHILLIAFLNEFGYDYQKTSRKKQKLLKNQFGDYKLLDNMYFLVRKFKLNRPFGFIESAISRAR